MDSRGAIAADCNSGLVITNGLCAAPSPPPSDCANVGESCVPDNQRMPATRKTDLLHPGDICKLDQFSEKTICDIPADNHPQL
jgi:hypothetical protein